MKTIASNAGVEGAVIVGKVRATIESQHAVQRLCVWRFMSSVHVWCIAAACMHARLDVFAVLPLPNSII